MTQDIYRLALIDISGTFGAAQSPQGAVNVHKKIQIMPLGEPRMSDGRKFKVTSEDLSLVLGDLSTRKNRIAVLYEHADGPRGEEAAGWIDSFEASDKGLFGYVVWNADAADAIKTKKWQYLSPGFMGAVDDEKFIRPRVLLEVSLTNIPAIDGMEPVTASSRAASEALGTHTPGESGSTPSPATDPTKEEQDMKLSSEALALLGLAEGASAEEIENTIKAKFAAKTTCSACGHAMHAKCSAADCKCDATDGLVPPMSAEVPVTMDAAPPVVPVPEAEPALPAPAPEPVVDEVQMRADAEAKVRIEFEAKEHAAKVATLVARADSEGKLTADTRGAFALAAEKDLVGAESLLATMKVVAPVSRVVSKSPIALKAYANEGERLTELFRYAARKNVSLDSARLAIQ